MPTPERGVLLETIRDAAARAAKAEGIRKTAREIGVSVTGFRAFLDGSSPFESTRKKLAGWYLRRVAAGAEGPAAGVAEAALAVLVEHLPAEERDATVRELRSVVEKRTRASGAPLPEWVRVVREEKSPGGVL